MEYSQVTMKDDIQKRAKKKGGSTKKKSVKKNVTLYLLCFTLFRMLYACSSNRRYNIYELQ